MAYRVKYARRGRAKHRVMTPLEMLARLSALIPPPRYPLVRYHGVLAPKSSWRKDVVPRPPVNVVATSTKCARENKNASVKRAVGSKEDASSHSPPLEKRREHGARDAIATTPPAGDKGLAPSDPVSNPRAPAFQRAQAELLAPNILRVEHWERLGGGALYAATPRVEWAKLLRRTFDVDILECAKCSGRLRVLGVVNDRAEARAILARLDMPTDAPLVARARDPTDDCFEDWRDDDE